MAEFEVPKVKPALSSEFDYFQSELVQAAIVSEFDKEYSPISIYLDDGPIQFEIKGADKQYLDLNNSKIEIKGKIVLAADGGNIPTDAAIGPANYFLHDLFQEVDIELQGQTVGDINNLYPYRAFIETLLSTNDQIQKTRLKSVIWSRDTNEQEADFRIEAGRANIGFKERALIFAQSAQVSMIGRLHSDLFHQNLDIPPNIDLKVRLLPGRKEFYLKKPAGNAVAYRFQINKARLLIRTKEASPSLVLAHERMLQKNNFRIPFNKVALKRLTVPTGVTNVEFDNIYTGQLPKRIICAMVRDTHMHGEYSTNPFFFQNFGLSYLSMKMNGMDIPRIPYQPNFATGDYIREYFLFLEGLGLDLGTKSINVTPSDWARNCNVYVFRLMPSGIASIPVTGSVRIEMKFAGATGHNINLLLYSESNALLEIDRYRNVIIG